MSLDMSGIHSLWQKWAINRKPKVLSPDFFAEFHCKAVNIMPGLNLEETVEIIHTLAPPTSK